MCFGFFGTSCNNLTVIQTPEKIYLSTGDYTEITCIWEKSIERYRVSWYLVNKENITKTISSELFYVSNITRESKDVLVIKSANVNDTGFYYCEIIIEIPFCKKVCGNGTTVIVEEKEAHSLKKRDLAIWTVIPFLVVVGSLYLCYKKKQHSKLAGSAQLARRHREEQMLEVSELHGTNEPTNEAAGENSSCNSAGWVVSTLYESLDTFRNESRGKDDKSTATIVFNAADEQIPQNRGTGKSRTRQGSTIYFDIQN
ncbi:uncharacterized protein LOC113479174 [Athene cunicularia]|uniref:uncharacterized protein LOC113479174 n=1 Tax=Athene cunicularia TaxID=194338 RepID=UPI000EF6522E|nr:uncharacterized protein LOC113479174 [Athene cunicularia]